MSNITISVLPEVKDVMDRFPEFNWSEFVTRRIEDELERLSKSKDFASRFN
ncbi:MAG: hypothetical protein Q7J54_00460 [Candidatus Woesearchaeota archaeon]|nr:hypothetical protein [Candidatus Woesearchaeota archaeon]